MFKHAFMMIVYLVSSIGMANSFDISGEDDWYPYSRSVNKSGEGIAVDLINAAYASVNSNVKIKFYPYARCMNDSKQGITLGCFDTLKDATTIKTHQFGKVPLFNATIKIYSRKSNLEKGLKVHDLEGKVIGITNGYTYGDAFELNKKIKKEIVLSDLIAMNMLIANRVDYILVYKDIYEYHLGQNKKLADEIKEVGEIGKLNLYVSFSKVNPKALEAMNKLDQGLIKIKKNGQYAKIINAWQLKLKAKN